jgi:Rho GDP-dissociation inhibitor
VFYFQPPPQKTIEELMKTDEDDESLRKYKDTLLGAAQVEKIIVGEGARTFRISKYSQIISSKKFTDPNDDRKVILKRLVLVVPDRDDMILDLTGDLSQLKKTVSTMYLF